MVWAVLLTCVGVVQSAHLEAATTLRAAADVHGLLIGAATNAGTLGSTSEPQYKTIEQAEFSITTAENSCKVGPIHPEEDKYDFSGCDAVFAAAADAKQKVRGHNLCWHQQNPDWLTALAGNKDKLVSALESHIDIVVKNYGNKAYAWDVVNEAISDGGAGQPVIKTNYPPWQPAVPDFIDRAFTFAKRAAGDNGPKLFYNDYGIELMGPKSDRLYEMVKGLQSRGVPIDGIGFQTHININWGPCSNTTCPSMEQNLNRFAALGLEVHITELDIRACDAKTTCDAAALEKQAEVYGALLNMCMGIPQCKVFEMWGFTDKHTWIDNFQNPTHKKEMPLPFSTNYTKKPCYDRMLQILNKNATSKA